MTVTGFGLNVHVAFGGQVSPTLVTVVRVTGPRNPNAGETLTSTVTVLPAGIGPNEFVDVVTEKSGAFRVITGVAGGVEHLFESITLHALTVIVVSLVIVPSGGAV